MVRHICPGLLQKFKEDDCRGYSIHIIIPKNQYALILHDGCVDPADRGIHVLYGKRRFQHLKGITEKIGRVLLGQDMTIHQNGRKDGTAFQALADTSDGLHIRLQDFPIFVHKLFIPYNEDSNNSKIENFSEFHHIDATFLLYNHLGS